MSVAAGDQQDPSIVSDGAGGVIVTWYDTRNGGVNYDIYAQRVSAAGVPLWTPNGVVVCAAADLQSSPKIATDGAGGAVIAWPDFRNGTNYDIYAQRVNAAGAPQWTANGVALCTAANGQSNVSIASDGTGGAIVAWQDFRGGATYDIYARRVNSAGVAQWTADGVGICTLANDQLYPGMVADGAGGAIVTWQDRRSGTNDDIYAQRVNSAGTAQWTANGQVVCTAANDQDGPVITADGAGGAIVAWYDVRNGNIDIYAQDIGATGASRWTANGVAVCIAASTQNEPALASDGAGGAILAWRDNRSGATSDIYAQRINLGGGAQWLANGVAIATATSIQSDPDVISDGSGGAIITWNDTRSGLSDDIYSQQVNASGATRWGANGVALSAAYSSQTAPTTVSDGAGGAIAVWTDSRSAATADIYAQRVERYGQLGNPEPSIAKIRDVPSDQGGKVNIQWAASYLDAAPGNPVDSYWIWRQVPTAAAVGGLPGGDAWADARSTRLTPRKGDRRATIHGTQVYYWEYVGSQATHGFPAYSYTATTLADSVGGGNPATLFMVEAEQASSGSYWGSAPDSGYSVDNLAPAIPAPFTGQYSAGTASLHWGRNAEADFGQYRLYRGISASFTPGPGNLLGTQPDTGYADNAAQGYYYKLAAVDIHGNQSGFALLLPQGAAGAPGSVLPTQVTLAPVEPNPVATGARIRFALPRPGRATLSLFDPQGRRVRELASGLLQAGEHTVSWDGRDTAGNLVPSGLYFCRLEAAGRTLSRRLVAVR